MAGVLDNARTVECIEIVDVDTDTVEFIRIVAVDGQSSESDCRSASAVIHPVVEVKPEVVTGMKLESDDECGGPQTSVKREPAAAAVGEDTFRSAGRVLADLPDTGLPRRRSDVVTLLKLFFFLLTVTERQSSHC